MMINFTLTFASSNIAHSVQFASYTGRCNTMQQPTNKDPASWLNSQLFQKALARYMADRALEVEDVHLAVHGNTSQQYSSTIYRACVSYRSRGKVDTMKVIVKLTTSKVNSLADEASFDTELKVYRDYLAKFDTVLGESNASRLGPKLIYTATDPVPFLILEDLTSHQLGHCNKLLGLEDAKIVLVKMAQFHAASYSLSSSTTVNAPDAVNNGLFKQKTSEGVKFMLENFTMFTEEIAHWEGCAVYAERLKKMLPTFVERGVSIYAGRGFSLNVLNHGDFHYNNMLFSIDSDEHRSVRDVVFFDFQLSCWTTPAVDLLYFLYLVCDRAARETRRHELVQLYHQEFTRTLDIAGYMGKVPTLRDIHCDLLRAGHLEVVLAVCFIPFLYADYNQAMNVYGNEEDARNYRRGLYNHPEYQAIIRHLLPFFLHKGFLD
uniref:CHK kinase-like domain-containing protein n=1 Tax=Anopheles farauti TaxID=69004 RepID=A0A182QN23_9DIPT